MHRKSLLTLVGSVLVLVYLVYLVMYLQHAEKTDMYMSDQDQKVRKVAVVLTWISIAAVSMQVICAVACMMGYKMPHIKAFSKMY